MAVEFKMGRGYIITAAFLISHHTPIKKLRGRERNQRGRERETLCLARFNIKRGERTASS